MMKKLTSTLCGLLFAVFAFAQSAIPVYFDECVDLVSVIWRLSGSQEYNKCRIPQYAEKVDEYFSPFKDHPVVQLARQYQLESGIGYDAVASYGLHLYVDDAGHVVLDDGFLKGSDPSFDRWSEQEKEEFLKPLNDFYQKTDFHKWYEQQQEVYEKVKENFKSVVENVDFDWFDHFFSTQSGSRFDIVLSLLVGPNNYGCSAQLQDSSYVLSPVIGSCELSENDDFFYGQYVLPIIIHEFCHPYCNPLNLQYWSLMSHSAEKVFVFKAEQLKKSAYLSALTMMNETFVRASVIRYLIAHYPQVSVLDLIQDEEGQGFILVQTLCDALKQYEQQRGSYPTMSEFMPVLAKTVNDFDLKEYIKQSKKADKLNATYKVSIKNGAKNVPSGLYTVVIKFSKPMVQGIAMNPSSSADFPTFKEYKWSDDKTLHVTFYLEPDHAYGFTVLGGYHRTQDGHTAGADREINFVTGK